MTVFVVLAVLLAAGLVGWLLLAGRRGRAGAAAARVSTREANISVYRDQLRELDADLAAGKLAPEDHERARRELEARLLEDVPGSVPVQAAGSAPAKARVPLAAAVAIPLLAIGIYLVVGSPGMVLREADHMVTAQQVEAMVSRLATRLRDQPDDVEGWKLLGRSYSALGRFQQAAEAYAHAATRAPRDAQLLADFADALAMARGQSLQGEPEQLVKRALEIEPANLKALALAGTAQYERKDYKGAAATWQRMLAVVPADSEDARAIQSNIDEALAMAGGAPRGSPPPKPAPPAAAAAALRGEVRLSDKLKKDASPDDVLFIYARAADGPPMPLAILRKQVRDLPVAFSLDDSMAMAPQARLSGFPKVIVTARVSKSGSATPQPGDLQGASPAVANDASGVRVLIDSVVR